MHLERLITKICLAHHLYVLQQTGTTRMVIEPKLLVKKSRP